MAIAFVNNAIYPQDNGTFVAFNCQAGNLVAVGLRYATGGPITGISDTAGNTFTKIISISGVNNLTAAELWYAKNTSANGSNVITPTFTGSTSFVWGEACQWSGIDTTSPLDTHDSGSDAGANSSVTTSGFTTTQADELIVNFSTVNGRNDSFTCSGFTQRAQDADSVGTMWEKIVSSIQTATVTTNDLSAARSWISLIGTFKASGGGGGSVDKSQFFYQLLNQ